MKCQCQKGNKIAWRVQSLQHAFMGTPHMRNAASTIFEGLGLRQSLRTCSTQYTSTLRRRSAAGDSMTTRWNSRPFGVYWWGRGRACAPAARRTRARRGGAARLATAWPPGGTAGPAAAQTAPAAPP